MARSTRCRSWNEGCISRMGDDRRSRHRNHRDLAQCRRRAGRPWDRSRLRDHLNARTAERDETGTERGRRQIQGSTSIEGRCPRLSRPTDEREIFNRPNSVSGRWSRHGLSFHRWWRRAWFFEESCVGGAGHGSHLAFRPWTFRWWRIPWTQLLRKLLRGWRLTSILKITLQAFLQQHKNA